MHFSAAMLLAPEWFLNHQTRYIVGAFHARTLAECLEPDDMWVSRHAYASVEKIKWLGPTEELTEFTLLFALDAALPARLDIPDVNRCNNEDEDLAAEIEAWLRCRPELVALDLVLHQEAIRRMRGLRQEALRSLVIATSGGSEPLAGPDVVYAAEGGVIRLTDGWYPPGEPEGWGTEYRAGPSNVSRLIFRRQPEWNVLAFNIGFVVGVEAEELLFIETTHMVQLSAHVTLSGQRRHVFVDVSPCKLAGEIAICAPRVLPIGAFAAEHPDGNVKISFGTGQWRFEKGSIGDFCG